MFRFCTFSGTVESCVSSSTLWDDENYLETPARMQDEPRWIVLGRIDGQVWAAIITLRDRPPGSSRCGGLDLSPARRSKREVQRVNVDFPAWMVSSLDAEASRLGVTRQAVIKTWIAERLDQRAS